MAQAQFHWTDGRPGIVGSFGSADDLRDADGPEVAEICDFAEIRLDLLRDCNRSVDSIQWRHLREVPLLFTARREEEGGAGALSAGARMDLLKTALDQAALIDIEVASIDEMGAILRDVDGRGIPWIASFHDFEKLPATAALEDAARRAQTAGASVFKAAARLHGPADIARLAEFQLGDHGIPVATMGMGPLAPVSRLLCAQCGSVLNYGYLGKNPTAPGQWDAALLKRTVARLAPFRL